MGESMKSSGAMSALLGMAMLSGMSGMGGGYGGGSIGTNAMRKRSGFSLPDDPDIPKGHEKFFFDMNHVCYDRAEWYRFNDKNRPEKLYDCICINRKRALKQFKTDLADAMSYEDIYPGDECNW